MTSKTIAAGAAFAVAAATLIAAPTAADAAGRGTTHVKVTSKRTVSAPATLRPGVVHLRNDGRSPVLIFRKKKDNAVKLVNYLNAHDDSSKKIFTRFGFVEYLMPKANDFVRLSKGTYYLVAGAGSKAKLKGVRTVTVKGRTANAVRPVYRNLYLSKKGTVTGATTATPRPYLRLRNLGSSFRIISSLPVKASVTAAELKAALADKSGDKVEDVIDEDSDSGFFFLIGGKQDITTRTTLVRGRYLVSSFGPDASIAMSGPQYFLLTVR